MSTFKRNLREFIVGAVGFSLLFGAGLSADFYGGSVDPMGPQCGRGAIIEVEIDDMVNESHEPYYSTSNLAVARLTVVLAHNDENYRFTTLHPGYNGNAPNLMEHQAVGRLLVTESNVVNPDWWNGFEGKCFGDEMQNYINLWWSDNHTVESGTGWEVCVERVSGVIIDERCRAGSGVCNGDGRNEKARSFAMMDSLIRTGPEGEDYCEPEA